MDTVELSPTVLDWAAAQVGDNVASLAHKVSKRSSDKIVAGILTYAQVLKFAKLSGVPLGYLFLDEPPAARLPPFADFRTLPDAHPLSKDFYDVYDDIEYKQTWLKERLFSQDAAPLPFVGKYRNDWPAPQDLAKEIRTTIGITPHTFSEVENPDHLFGSLSEKCEQIGIWIFKNGVVGNNTRRTLSVKEFRGFAISDELCPVIFVNGADAPAAWVFTLAHELAHIWIGDSGISDAAAGTDNKTESYCNLVAGEILIPTNDFLLVWNQNDRLSDDAKMELTRKTFKVSKTVVARKASDLGLIQRRLYFEVYDQARKAAKNENKKPGGDFYRTLPIRNSKTFSKRVVNLAVGGEITLGLAGRLLNTNPNNIVKLFEKQNAISI
jgi:Zn-dependent peptidase ImmA (M78 family)